MPHRFCDPTNVPLLHYARCVAAEQSSPSYLVLGMLKTSAQHPGFPDKHRRKGTLAHMVGGVFHNAISPEPRRWGYTKRRG